MKRPASVAMKKPASKQLPRKKPPPKQVLKKPSKNTKTKKAEEITKQTIRKVRHIVSKPFRKHQLAESFETPCPTRTRGTPQHESSDELDGGFRAQNADNASEELQHYLDDREERDFNEARGAPRRNVRTILE